MSVGYKEQEMKIDVGDYKITLEFDSHDETLGKEDIKEALEFIWYASHVDIPIEEMDEMWAGAKGKLGYISRGFRVGRFELDGKVIDDHHYAYVKFDLGQVHVKLDDEGVVVDIWNVAEEEIVDSVCVEYDDLKGPCLRQMDEGWTCVNDHTGCIWNDGHNGCNAEDWMGNQPLKCSDTFFIENEEGERWTDIGADGLPPRWTTNEAYNVFSARQRVVTRLPEGGKWVRWEEPEVETFEDRKDEFWFKVEKARGSSGR